MTTRKGRFLAIFTIAALVLATAPTMAITSVADTDYGTQRDYVVSLIKAAGMSESALGTDSDRDALAKSLGFLDSWDYQPTAPVDSQTAAAMDAAMGGAFDGLRDALGKKPLEPYFVHGMAQPIFPYGNSIYYDTSEEGVVRFAVYVETDLDTDGDGKLDLVKALVQLPRAALEGAKLSTIFEARPYIEGTNGQSVAAAIQTAGNNYLAANAGFGHPELYKTAPPRIPAGVTTTGAMVANANFIDWYYRYSGGSASAGIVAGNGSNETEYEDLNWYDYFLVRGFAVVMSPGIGSAGSEGYSTCGSDVEINSFRCVIEWLTGDRVAYSDKTGNIEIKADWSNGNVGMTGLSYAGATQFGLATTGVEGLKTIVPAAGIASWYEYTNSQGAPNSIPYTVGLAWHCNSRLGSGDWAEIMNRYAGYSQTMRQEETALNGDYGAHWARRDYTAENWFRDWGPSKIRIPILIVHGANDDNVRPKQSELMYEAAKKAGVEVRWLWHQGHHVTPMFPAATPNATATQRPYSMYCGDYMYDEWLNLWFSRHLYGVDNGVMELMPNVLAMNNYSGEWVPYEAWESASGIILDDRNRVVSLPDAARLRSVGEEPVDYSEEFPIPGEVKADATDGPSDVSPDDIVATGDGANTGNAAVAATLAESVEGSYTTVNSANGSSSWQNFLNAPTAGSSLYSMELAEDATIKGVAKVNLRAAISSPGASAGDPLRVHVKLVEVAKPGTTLKYYGGNAVGSTVNVDRIATGGAWQGGGASSYNLVKFRQTTTGTYREIAKGWMDLTNPSAGYDSYTAARADRIIA
ncbi:MAG: hypothetical protein LBG71_07120, partial [Clostridiales Family XIII bacterium]|nr:hypothetical protein [Clostridiales Family XIII bacterium]